MYVKGCLKRMCMILKIPGLNGDSNPDLCDAGASALLVELSGQLGAGYLCDSIILYRSVFMIVHETDVRELRFEFSFCENHTHLFQNAKVSFFPCGEVI